MPIPNDTSRPFIGPAAIAASTSSQVASISRVALTTIGPPFVPGSAINDHPTGAPSKLRSSLQ